MTNLISFLISLKKFTDKQEELNKESEQNGTIDGI